VFTFTGMCCAKLPPAKQKGSSMSSLAGIRYFTHEPGYYRFTRNHKLLMVVSIRFQRYLEVHSVQPWALPAVFHSFMVSPWWGGADVANNTIPCTDELCSISTALWYSPPVSGIPHTHTHTHTHTYTVDNAFKTVKSTMFLDFVHCFYSKKELLQILDLFPSWSERLERHLLCCVWEKQLFSVVGQSMPVTLLYVCT